MRLLLPVLVGTFVFGTAAAKQRKAKGVDRAAYARPDSIPAPADNATTPERVALGRTLFFDPRLSGSRWISCATCHNPALSYGDGLPTAIGHGMEVLERRTPTIVNLAWSTSMFWDGRMATLEEQALGPVEAAGEMNLPIDQMEDRLRAIEGYGPLFEAAYPGEGIGAATAAKAIAAFERTVVSGEAPFDRWVAGDDTAISASAARGFDVFHRADCHQCHSGWRFTDDGFYDIGIDDGDLGRGAVLPIPAMAHTFKTPTLRDVSRRAPYMHAGTLATLADVVEYYDRGGDADRQKNTEHVRPLGLSQQDKDDLVAFLLTLTGPTPPIRVPELPR